MQFFLLIKVNDENISPVSLQKYFVPQVILAIFVFSLITEAVASLISNVVVGKLTKIEGNLKVKSTFLELGCDSRFCGLDYLNNVYNINNKV